MTLNLITISRTLNSDSRPLAASIYSATTLGSSQFSTTANKRHCAQHDNQQSAVRVRFAPSPTGSIHLGGLRAALYNYIFARQHVGGKFVLRIEDTDQARLVANSAKEIEDVLEWAGIGPDESPRVGGPHGPYEQSKRLNIYNQYAKDLLEKGQAYRCFCSATRLDLLRKYQARNREKIRYDGKCKHLTPAEVEEKLAETKGQYVIRFALTEGQESFNDLVFGTITNNLVEALESDPIIIKSDGYPTYHFANIIDDHLMNISHVLRGSEWISSTIKHVQLYKAFQWSPPQFLHLPLVTMHDGSKMSKRNDHSHVMSWIQAGYQPETLFNFLTNSGGGVPKSKQDSNEFWTLDELVKGFDFNQLTSHPGSLDVNRLRIYSAKELKLAWTQDRRVVMRRYKEALDRKQMVADISDQLAETIIERLIDRLTSIDDLLSHDYIYIWSRPKLSWSPSEYTDRGWILADVVGNLLEIIKSKQLDLEQKEKFNTVMQEFAQKHQLEFGSFMKFVRKLLTNSEKGLPVYEICTCLGVERLIEYLASGLEYVSSNK